MTNSVLAIDAAWTSKEPSGVALLRHRGGLHWECLAVCPSYSAFTAFARGEEFDWRSKHEGSVPEPASLLRAATTLLDGDPPALVTIDMPVATIPFTQPPHSGPSDFEGVRRTLVFRSFSKSYTAGKSR